MKIQPNNIYKFISDKLDSDYFLHIIIDNQNDNEKNRLIIFNRLKHESRGIIFHIIHNGFSLPFDLDNLMGYNIVNLIYFKIKQENIIKINKYILDKKGYFNTDGLNTNVFCI